MANAGKNMKDLWNEISYYLLKCKERNSLEKDYENTIVHCLTLLGWKQSLGDINTQCPVQVGHETKLADIVVSSEGVEHFVIEVKRPGHIISSKDEQQLFSYMRVRKFQFGLYIGEDIRLYYDDSTSAEITEPAFIVDITKDNSDGESLVELLSKGSFDVERLREFCIRKKEEALKASMKEQIINEEIIKLLNDTEGAFFKNLYREYCITKGMDDDFSERVLEKISFKVSPYSVNAECNSVLSEFNIEQVRKERSDKGIRRAPYQPKTVKKFSFNGSQALGCSRLALTIVKQFIKDNPNCTYIEIQRALPAWAKLRTIDEIKYEKSLKNDEFYERRWFTDDKDMMMSSDGKVFALTTQWSAKGMYSSDIQPMIDFARRQGYDVKEL